MCPGVNKAGLWSDESAKEGKERKLRLCYSDQNTDLHAQEQEIRQDFLALATAIVETASVQMERAAPSMAGAEPLLNIAVVVAVAARLPQAQAHVATAIAATASAQMERAAPSMAGVEPPPTIVAAGCCVGTMATATQQKQRQSLSFSLRRRRKCLMT